MVELALYQPDIPQNLGTILRMGACLGLTIHVIEPCGFPLDDRKIRRAAMDYIDHVTWIRHASWAAFTESLAKCPHRLVLLTTKAAQNYHEFAFQADDILLIGKESSGVPDEVHNAADARITIPMQPPMRSLNMAVAAAMVTSVALTQTQSYPQSQSIRSVS